MEITIKTKFNIGQEVYWMSDNTIRKGTIYYFHIEQTRVTERGVSIGEIRYIIGAMQTNKGEQDLFASQGELLADLITKSKL